MIPNKTFCVLPWLSLEASPIGTVRPCCLADDEIVDNYGDKFDLNTASLADIQDSNYMTELRGQFLLGNRPKTCRKCWDEEDSGRTSKRQNTQNRLSDIIAKSEWSTESNTLSFLDLKLGNICNLKCRICGSWSSSNFAGEELRFVTGDKKKSFHYEMKQHGQWPRNASAFWNELDQLSPQIEYLEFTGGEPFLIKEHFQYLQRLVDSNRAKHVSIHYNTNGTQWPEEYIKVWEHFKHVEIAFSIDNVGKRFEYERTNASWDEVNRNIKKFMILRNTSKNIALQLCVTINIYNVLYLHDITSWEHFADFDLVHWNMLHDAPHNCIQSLPPLAKQVAKARLTVPSNQTEAVQREFNSIAKFIEAPAKVSQVELLQNINQLDNRRGVSLETTHRELYKVLYEKAPR